MYENLPKTREEAKREKISRYIGTRPCKKCNNLIRFTSNRRCINCSKLLNKKYYYEAKQQGVSFSQKDYNRLVQRSKEGDNGPWITKTYFQAKIRAKRKKIIFDISKKDLSNLIVEKCPVLGIPLDYTLGDKKYARDNSPSLDRINPNEGYTKENIIVISYRANSIKQNATVEELSKVYNFYKELY